MWSKRISHFCGDHSKCDWSNRPCYEKVHYVHAVEAQKKFKVGGISNLVLMLLYRKYVITLVKQWLNTNYFQQQTLLKISILSRECLQPRGLIIASHIH
jgi:hypothetical protein